jgi:hypothetical protein
MSYNGAVRPTVLAALLVLAALPSRSLPPDGVEGVDIDHETWSVIGWNDACGVAFEHLYYPKLGQAVVGEPVSTHLGTATIPPGKENYAARWVLQAEGKFSRNEREVAKAKGDLRAAGYTRAGFPELIQDAPIGDQPLLADTLLSTATLATRLTNKNAWPGPEWRWAGGSYSPLGTCALLAYELRGSPRHYRLLLLRIYNSRVRRERAYAHASNARLLFNAGSLAVAATEAETAARLDPDLPIGRYEHAAMLAMTGNPAEAVAELVAAVRLEPSYRAKARDDVDFDNLRDRDDFKDLTRRPTL